VNHRVVLAALVAFWLAFGSLAGAWAQQAGQPCESMGMSLPADDCCGDSMDQTKCLSACLAVSPAMAVRAVQVNTTAATAAVIAAPSFRHASVLAPPDIAPPKTSVS
jgi:hypothetical protein